MTPTDEQLRCIELFETGEDVAIEAGAGTGKTSTLVLLAKSEPRKRGQYAAFNKAIVEDSGSKMPNNVRANTMHSLAFRAIGSRYAHRLNSARISSNELAFRLNTQTISLNMNGEAKMLNAQYLASLAMKAITNFCLSADPAPSEYHVPYINGIDMPQEDGKRGYTNNNIVRQVLMAPMKKAWKDIQDPGGQLPFKHDAYLKIWEMNRPVMPGDFILFDEAQDADPVQLSIVRQQNCQKVFVGDSQQQIYEWRGALNALSSLGIENRPFLTQSFRFGPEIAEVANELLGWITAPLRLKGLSSIRSVVDSNISPDAILCRTNAAAIRNVIVQQLRGRRVHLLGGAKEMLSFVRGVEELKAIGNTYHPDLACFASWGAVQDYVENDPQGSDLKLWVTLVDEFGTDSIRKALSNTDNEGPGVVTVSTAHKAKGRQWGSVRLADDFAPLDPDKTIADLSTAELRLIYVAVTRAQFGLDWSSVSQLVEKEAEAAS